MKEAATTGGAVRNRTWYAQLDFGADSDLAPQAELGTNLFGALTHVRQTPVPRPSCVQVLRIDALSVVSNAQADLTYTVGHLRFDVTRLRVKERIAQRLAHDAVHVIAKERIQFARRSLDGGAERHRALLTVWFLSEFFGKRCNRLSQFVGDVCRGAEILNGVAAFDDGLVRPIERAIECLNGL